MTVGNGNRVREMTEEEITEILAQKRVGTKVTVCYGRFGVGTCFVFSGLEVLTKEPRDGRDLPVERIELSEGLTLQRNTEGWICHEAKKAGRSIDFDLVAVKAA